MDMENIEEKIIDMLAEVCDDDDVRDDLDADLFATDMLDSLAFVELLFAIEEEFGVVIAPSEVDKESLNTANKIIELVKSHL